MLDATTSSQILGPGLLLVLALVVELRARRRWRRAGRGPEKLPLGLVGLAAGGAWYGLTSTWPLSSRVLSDFLDHPELLGLLATYISSSVIVLASMRERISGIVGARAALTEAARFALSTGLLVGIEMGLCFTVVHVVLEGEKLLSAVAGFLFLSLAGVLVSSMTMPPAIVIGWLATQAARRCLGAVGDVSGGQGRRGGG